MREGTSVFTPFLMASKRTLRASLISGRLAGWCLLVTTSWMAWGGGEAMAPAEGKAGTGGGPDGQGEELRAPGRGRGGGGGGGGSTVPSNWVPEPIGWPRSRRRAGEEEWRGGATGGGAGWSTPGAIWRGAGAGGMAGSCCWSGSGGTGGGGVPRMPVDGNGGGGGGRGGGGGGGVLELRPAVRAGDWGLLSEKPEPELEEGKRKKRLCCRILRRSI